MIHPILVNLLCNALSGHGHISIFRFGEGIVTERMVSERLWRT